MTLQKINQNQEQALAIIKNHPSLTNFGPSKVREIILATQGIRVRQVDPADDEPIKQVLRYIFTLIGLKADNIPDDVQKAVLINYIRQDLANYGLEEFKVAFHLLINGELDMDPTHYQNFSPLYLGQVMRSYFENNRAQAMKAYRLALDEEEKKKREALEQDPEFKKKIHIEFLQGTITFGWTYFKKTGTLTFGICPWSLIYKVLVEEVRLFEPPTDLKKQIYSQAVEAVDREMSRKNKQFNSVHDVRQFKKILEQIQEEGLEKTCKQDIINKCHELTIHHYFKQFMEDGVDVEQVIKDYINTL